jgi:hypothetical protein
VRRPIEELTVSWRSQCRVIPLGADEEVAR